MAQQKLQPRDLDASVKVTDTLVPSGDAGKALHLFSWLANRIKAIIGGTSWRDEAPISLQTLSKHANRHQPGSPDALPTAAPNGGVGSLNKEGIASTFARSDHQHKVNTATTINDGLMSASDKSKLDTLDPAGSNLMRYYDANTFASGVSKIADTSTHSGYARRATVTGTATTIASQTINKSKLYFLPFTLSVRMKASTNTSTAETVCIKINGVIEKVLTASHFKQANAYQVFQIEFECTGSDTTIEIETCTSNNGVNVSIDCIAIYPRTFTEVTYNKF